jgi:hypothetical protein
MIDTRHQWIAELERLSPIIKAYDLTNTAANKAAAYVDRTSNPPDRTRDKDAFNVANSAAHNAIVVDAVAALQGKMPDDAIRSLLGELTSKKTYGAFSELVAYNILLGLHDPSVVRRRSAQHQLQRNGRSRRQDIGNRCVSELRQRHDAGRGHHVCRSIDAFVGLGVLERMARDWH